MAASVNSPLRYNVEISPVREVMLRGTADFSFWKERLRHEDLVPSGDGRRAQLLVTAIESRFMGLRFREASLAVFVDHGDGGGPEDAAYLLQAFNSSRMFAFVERTFYHTPYDYAAIRVSTRLPAAFEIGQNGGAIFRAEMSAGSSASSRRPARCREEGWEGPIFLPRAKSRGEREVFFGRLGGHMHAYPFLPEDELTIHPTDQVPILGWLVESEFAGQEWGIRETATHARSRTVKRSSVLLSPAGQPG
jgi:hypothetical protein